MHANEALVRGESKCIFFINRLRVNNDNIKFNGDFKSYIIVKRIQKKILEVLQVHLAFLVK